MAKEAEWERHARDGEWWRINVFDLSASEQKSLLERLEEIVPKREFGDRLEIYEDFIRPNDAKTREEFDAVLLLQDLQSVTPWVENHPDSAPLQKHIALANDVLREHGFESIREDYVYWSPKFQKWRKLQSGVGRELKEEETRFGKKNKKLSKFFEWINKYPWRKSVSVLEYVNDIHERYTELWCAVRILYEYEHVAILLEELLHRRPQIPRNKRRLRILGLVSKAARIGTLGEVLHWKRGYGDAAIRGLDVGDRQVERAKKGGKSRQDKARLARQKLEELALAPENLPLWLGKSEKQRVTFLRKLASDFNETNDELLFQQKEELLSRSWFEDRLGEWQAVGKIDQALKKVLKRQ